MISPERVDPPSTAGERSMLVAYLRYHRSTLAGKCAGLRNEELARRSVFPSSLSLLGLVRHVTEVEGSWMQEWAGQPYTPRYYSPEHLDDDFDALDSAPVAQVMATWAEVAAGTDAILGREPLDVEGAIHPRQGVPVPTLRWVAIHLIEEYARHNGHADLLREAIDGATGE